MLARFGLTLVAAVGMLVLTGGSAEAQNVTVRSGYNAGDPTQGRPPSTSPGGIFDTRSFPAGDGGKYRVLVDYGTARLGVPFEKVPANDPAAPTGDYPSQALSVGRGGVSIPWGVGTHYWKKPATANYRVRARLQRSTDEGVTWVTEATAYDQCQ